MRSTMLLVRLNLAPGSTTIVVRAQFAPPFLLGLPPIKLVAAAEIFPLIPSIESELTTGRAEPCPCTLGWELSSSELQI